MSVEALTLTRNTPATDTSGDDGRKRPPVERYSSGEDGDDYVRLGIEEAELYADNPFVDDEVDVDLPPRRGGGTYEVLDVGKVARLAGRAGMGEFAPGFNTGHITLRRQEMPRVISRLVIPWPQTDN